jgi:photosystem II stability/assembly factor-like uncharacterized protein
MHKKFILIAVLILVSAGCNPLAKTIPGGVIKSVNGGADWQFANTVTSEENASLSTLSFSKLDFDPKNRQTLFAGSYTDGVFKSEDSGDTWKKILSKIAVYDLAVNPQDPKIIYAAGYFGEHGRVLKTTDGGASWNEVYNEGSADNPVRTVALNPENPNQIIIGTASGNAVKSADGGNTWQLAKDFGDRINRIFWQRGNIYVLLRNKGLFKSPGFADNFSEITTGLNKTYDFSQLSYTTLNPISFFNQMFVDSASPDLIYMTTDRGLYKTRDGGKNWTLQNLPIKPDKADGRAIAISKTSSNIVYTSVGATIYKSLDGGVNWQTQGVNVGGFVNYILIDPELPQIVYAGVYNTQ